MMPRRKFFMMLCYLHCCPAQNQDPNKEGYDPVYKVAEIQKALEERFDRLFVPGQELSLDESLIRSFGRMKFKVRIISKSARYGIKIYVITDAKTSFVLCVIIYTGKTTYNIGGKGEEMKKTVQVVNKLVEKYAGTYRSVYIDRFYTSIELLKSLAEKDLLVTGTVMQNRLPKGVRITAAEYKRMTRGEAMKKKFVYRKANGTIAEAGLTCWQDGKLVYCLSNDSPNAKMSHCYRRVDGGCKEIPRPESVGDYNTHMGGMDVADLRRKRCDSTIMGLNRWWLKLFFIC